MDSYFQYFEGTHLNILFKGLGALVFLKLSIDLFGGIYSRLLRPGTNLKRLGKWAVVTGATDGIGFAMCEEMARKGLNIVLISRSLDKLKASCGAIESKFPNVQVKTLDIDFSKFDEHQRQRVGTLLFSIADDGIAVLVNNVGVSYPFTKYFHELQDENVSQLISINIDSTTWMTRLALPHMLERKKGAIVNISSAAGVSTSPLLAQYGAAKSYVAMFSRALNYELKEKGIHVQCQVPMFVATKLAKIRSASLFVASPEGYARAAVAAIGHEVVVSPFWSHAIQIWLLTNLPEWICAALTLTMHKDIRRKGMKKEEKEADGSKEKKN